MGSAPSKGEPHPNNSTKDEGDSQTPFNSPTKKRSQTQKPSRKNTHKSENGSTATVGTKQIEIAAIVKTGAAGGQTPNVQEQKTSAADVERDALKQQLLDSEAMMKGMMAQMAALASKVNEVKPETTPTRVVDSEVADESYERIEKSAPAAQPTKKKKKNPKGDAPDDSDTPKVDDLNNTGEFSHKKQSIPVSTLDPTSPDRRNAAGAKPVVSGDKDLPALRNESLPLTETHLHNFDKQHGRRDSWPDSLGGSRASSDFSEPPEIAAELAAAARTPRPKSASQHGRPKSGHRRKIDDQVFERFAVSVFRLADTNFDNFLSVEDLESASSSQILSMVLDKDVANKLFKKATKNIKGLMSGF
eukprot:m.92414 g.92414  ORF g.92414 m.92414 type:complete len:360 (-) comp26544_c0_seq1:2975-4054(-)